MVLLSHGLRKQLNIMITRDDILSFSEGEIKEIIIPQWESKDGGRVNIRSLSYGEINEFRSVCNSAGLMKLFGMEEASAMQTAKDMLLIKSLCDKSGVRLLKDDDLEKVRSIQGQTEVFEFLFEEIIKFNKILKKDRDELDGSSDQEEDIKKKLST